MESSKLTIMRATMEAVRMYGMEGVRTSQIGKLAGISSSVIYQYFNGKVDLMRACFDHVDRQIAQIFDRVRLDPERLKTDPQGEVRKLWTAYYRWLLAHPDETVFYHRYRDTPGFPDYDRSRDYTHFTSFIEVIHQFNQQYHVDEKIDQSLLWAHVLSSTVMYAKYVLEGRFPQGDSAEETLFQLMMNGLRGLLREGG